MVAFADKGKKKDGAQELQRRSYTLSSILAHSLSVQSRFYTALIFSDLSPVLFSCTNTLVSPYQLLSPKT